MFTYCSPAAPLDVPVGATPDIRHRPAGPRRRGVLHPTIVSTLEEHRLSGGLLGLEAAGSMSPSEIVSTVLESGLRGRGGAGFPTGRKWQTVATNALGGPPARVVVNGAEGEPGTFKDRAILRHNPYRVIEGAFIGAKASTPIA